MIRNSREIIKLLKSDGWFLVRVKGDHHQFKHNTKKGTVTVPHPKKYLPPKTIKSIFKQAGWQPAPPDYTIGDDIMDNVVYPVIIKHDKDDKVYYVSLPDFDDGGIATYADSFEEAIANAKDVIALYLYDLKEDGNNFPKPSNIEKVDVGYGSKIVLVDLWLPYHFSKVKDVYKKKTLTIPTWLDSLATQKNINFSNVLQKALKKELGIDN